MFSQAVHLGILAVTNILGLLLFGRGIPMAACGGSKLHSSTMYFMCCILVTISTDGFVTVRGDEANLTLNANVAGSFQCQLDGGSFQSCTIINDQQFCIKISVFLQVKLVHCTQTCLLELIMLMFSSCLKEYLKH